FTVRLMTSLLSDVRREEWDALVGDASPFLEWGWVASLEDARFVGGRSGWSPQHLGLFQDDRLVEACPMYLKTNSEGEFVFDWSWADAANRAGIDYYPKMVVGVPFTPATGHRVLWHPSRDRGEVVAIFAKAVRTLTSELSLSSGHVLFPDAD